MLSSEKQSLSSEPEVSAFFIDLDCLIDTRFCVIEKLINIDTIKEFITSKYHLRETDKFPNIGFSKFNNMYKNRDKTILKNALPTYMQNFVADFANATIENTINSPFKQKPLLIVNIHPYDFTEQEEVLLIKSLSVITKKICDIQIVKMTKEDITPSYVKNNLSILCIYEYAEWIELHSVNDNFKKITCPEVTMIGPMISFKENFNKLSAKGENPFEMMEAYMSPLIGLTLFPIKMFSFKVNIANKTG